jgi:hypothetical protein
MGLMRRSAALLLALAGTLLAVPAAAAPPVWQPVAEIAGVTPFTQGIPRVDSSPSPSVAATPTPSPNPRRSPQSPAAFFAIIVAVAVLGAGALAVVRARWR